MFPLNTCKYYYDLYAKVFHCKCHIFSFFSFFYLSFEIKQYLDKGLFHLESSGYVHSVSNRPHLFFMKNYENIILYITVLMLFFAF